jgi:uncharacterized protein YrrD
MIEGPDGRVGILYDILFDDHSWKVCNLLISRDRWFYGQQTLIEPKYVARANWQDQKLSVQATKKQIQQWPTIAGNQNTAAEKTRQGTQAFTLDAYWMGVVNAVAQNNGNPRIRSTKVLNGMHVYVADELVGHIDDFVVDDETWTIRYFVIETRNWCPGKRILVELTAIESICWEDGQVSLSLSRDEIYDLPAYDVGTFAEQATVGSAN